MPENFILAPVCRKDVFFVLSCADASMAQGLMCVLFRVTSSGSVRASTARKAQSVATLMAVVHGQESDVH